MQYFKPGDLVLVINSIYHPDNIGRIGTVVHDEDHFSGVDMAGQVVSGRFVIVDLPGAGNRHGTTLWYFRTTHLLRIAPRDPLQDIRAESALPENCC